MTHSGLAPTCSVVAIDAYGNDKETQIAGEFPLTIYVDRQEIVTLMTLGGYPEALVLGYLKNQHLIKDIEDIKSVQVDWETNAVAINTNRTIEDLESKLEKKTVTTGCGQGTVFGDLMEGLDQIKLNHSHIKQSTIYDLLYNLREYNDVYKSAGAVHGCALCEGDQIVNFVEDVGRHNAVDAIAGMMWLDRISGDNKIFYTTGRLTSEMVIKVAQMGVSVLLSRSGITQMGLDLAKTTGVTMIARAKGKHFLIFNGSEHIEFDAPPPARTRPEE